MLALAALLEIADASGQGPVPASLQLRALLSLLYWRSDRQREPYASFWATVIEATAHPQDGYRRGTYARTHWMGIVRSLGAEPQAQRLYQEVRALIHQHGGGLTDLVAVSLHRQTDPMCGRGTDALVGFTLPRQCDEPSAVEACNYQKMS